ncbi:IS1380 family transposase [Enhygromyxa salina]|uniref:Transposase DDE domain-containing protein n=1 Tax=Enhygromyxa salina TaxID=215803 RepID=A0A2S9YY94_9BACT|nr:IS1380 family transposase [Enhygromyxa salina]PRQ10056.1 hypothetical protein ENSA7_02620 [Enhygromyxa salina]
MKSSKAEIVSRVHTLPEVSFEDHRLTSFSGLVLFIALFKRLQLMAGLRRCFRSVDRDRVFGLARVVQQLVIHVALGFRRLRDRDYYADDPLIQRALGVRKIPDVSTITRTLAAATEVQVTRFRKYVGELTLDRVETEKLARITADFDGSVLSTKGHVEGTAVGFNPKRKGARSYYPLFCVLSQLGMFLDMLHRSGNVHDSNGSVGFIRSCITALRTRMPRAVIESRLDSAFFNENVLDLLEDLGVEYAMAIPFAAYPGLKHRVHRRERWRPIDDDWSYFELDWRPKTWAGRRRVICIRRRRAARRKGPLQLDLFEPIDDEFEFKVIVTNKTTSADNVLHFFNGRGLNEAVYAEAKQFAALDYIPCRRRVANEIFTCSTMLAHNLGRELQMQTSEPTRRTTPTRAPLYVLKTLGTLRHLLLRQAGRLTRPQGVLRLSTAASGVAQREFKAIYEALAA